MLKERSIYFKLLSFLFIGLLLNTAFLLGGYIFSTGRISDESQKVISEKVLSEVKNRLQFTVQATITAMENLYRENLGKLPEEEIRGLVKREFDAVKYSDAGYFFVYQYDGIRLVAPENKSQEGKNLWDLTDSKGNKPVQEFIKAAKKGGAFVQYVWLNPKSNRQEDKLSYIAPLSLGDLELAVGTGTYLPMIAQAQADITSKINAVANVSFNSLLIIELIIAAIILLLVMFLIKRSVVDSLNRMASKLKEGAYQVASASNQLSSSAQQLSQGSAEQAASIEEISSTLQESITTLQQNNENIRQVAKFSEQAKESANHGNNQMQQMMNSMEEIKKSSDQIAKIIKVIDDIAFQTNILALNAAIEAARAGEAGSGFAVVAEEVRNLAGRSAQAAKDTTTIVESNIELSGQGVSIAQKVREALEEITIQAKKVNDLFAEISESSQEQTLGIEQVNKGMAQIETVTQGNSANAEESASASEELNAQAENLRKIVLELSILVNGAKSALMEEKKTSENVIHQVDRNVNRPVPGINTAGRQNIHSDFHPADKAKTRVVSPEDVIPLEKDPHRF